MILIMVMITKDNNDNKVITTYRLNLMITAPLITEFHLCCGSSVKVPRKRFIFIHQYGNNKIFHITIDNDDLCDYHFYHHNSNHARWFSTAENRDVRTRPLACPLARSLAPLTHSLAPHCSHRTACTIHSFACSALPASLARSAALIRSFVRLFARSLTRSQARGTVEYLCPGFQVF